MKQCALVFLAMASLNAVGSAGGDAVTKELKLLEGTWSYISLERDGKLVPAEDLRKLTWTVKDDGFSVKFGAKVLGPGVLKIDPAKTPKTIDITPSEGSNKGKTERGIYQVDGDTLKVCTAQPGKARPEEFASRAGSGHSLGVLKRKKA